jgi:predicted HicB family RNase H-like nuclease
MKTIFDVEEYAISCRRMRTPETGAFTYEATVAELPDVVGYGETRAEAEEAVLEALRGLQELAQTRGRTFPAPIEIPTQYTGRVTTRLSKTIHKQAANLARAEGISLNAFICEAVSLRVAGCLLQATARPQAPQLTTFAYGSSALPNPEPNALASSTSVSIH